MYGQNTLVTLTARVHVWIVALLSAIVLLPSTCRGYKILQLSASQGNTKAKELLAYGSIVRMYSMNVRFLISLILC